MIYSTFSSLGNLYQAYLILNHTIMKKLGTLLITLFLGLQFGSAQSDVEEIDFIQSIIGAETKAVVGNFIDIPEASVSRNTPKNTMELLPKKQINSF